MYQVHSPPLTRVNKYLIIVCVGLFLLNAITLAFFKFPLIGFLGLSPGMVTSGHIYQFLTYPFITDSFFAILFECLLLWYLGSELESLWGEKTYLKFLAASVLGAGLVYFLLSITVFRGLTLVANFHGLTGFCYSLCLAYAIIYSDRYLNFMLIFPMKAKWFCTIMMAILLYLALTSGDKSAWGHLAAMGSGFLYLKFKASKMSGKPMFGNPSAFLQKLRTKSKKRKHPVELYIIKDDDDDDRPTYH